MTISSWLSFGRSTPPGRGSAVGRKFLAPPYYSQCSVFASLSASFIILYFFVHAPRSNAWIVFFHALWLIRRVFAEGRSFLGLRQCRNSFRAISPKWGVNRPFQAKLPEYKIAISCKIWAGSTCNFRRMLRPSDANRGWSALTSYQI